ncbi:MAG: hypothetical protein WDN48_17885 [Pseudolabrys sp.]
MFANKDALHILGFSDYRLSGIPNKLVSEAYRDRAFQEINGFLAGD